MATGSLLDEVRWMVQFSEDNDTELGLFEKRTKQKGGKRRRTEENQAIVPLSLKDRVQGQLTPNVVPKWLVTVLAAIYLKQQNKCKKYMCRYTHTHTYTHTQVHSYIYIV